MTQDQRPGHEDEEPQKEEPRDLPESEEQGDEGGGGDREDYRTSINFDRDIPGGQSD